MLAAELYQVNVLTGPVDEATSTKYIQDSDAWATAVQAMAQDVKS